MAAKIKQQNILDGWQARKLSSMFEVRRGGSPRPIEQYITNTEDGFNWLKIGDIDVGGKYIIKTSSKILKEGLSRTTLVKKGDFILSNSMSYGRPYIMDIEACIHDGWLTFQNIDTSILERDFLYYLLSSSKTQAIFTSISAGSGVQNLKKETVSEVVLSIPSIPEQSRIVTVLETWDQVIEKLKRKIEVKKEIKKGLMHDLLTGKTRLSGFSGSWTKIKLGSISNVVSGGTPSTLNRDYWENGNIPWMKSGEINKVYVESTDNFITNLGLAESSAQLLPCNSVLIALAGQGTTRGKVAINKCELSTNQSVAAFIPIKDLDYRFLFFDLSRRYDELRSLSAGDGGRGGLNLMLLKNLQIQLPELSEQMAIAQVLSIGDEEIQLLNKKLSILKDQKKYLLNNLVTGTIRTPESLSIPK